MIPTRTEDGGRRAGRPRIAIVDYRAGNLTSVLKALNAVGGDAYLAVAAEHLGDADAIVIPGVGHFAATGAIDQDLRRALELSAGVKPILGICLGMQFLFDGSEESAEHRGLGLLPGTCRRLEGAVKVPHVGWNDLQIRRPSSLLRDVAAGTQAYFTHSYAAPVTGACVATTEYAMTFASVVEHDNIFGVQFHPEKSSVAGLAILRSFVKISTFPNSQISKCSPSA